MGRKGNWELRWKEEGKNVLMEMSRNGEGRHTTKEITAMPEINHLI